MTEQLPLVYRDLIIDPLTGGEFILLHPVEPRWALANATGLALCRLWDGSRTIGDAAAELATHYGLPIGSVAADVVAFHARLQAAGLVENDPPPHVTPPPRRKSRSLTIYTTEQCNLRCRHCAIVEGRMPDPDLTSDDVRRIIDEHVHAYAPIATVSFLGGEPLLHPDWKALLLYATGKRIGVGLATNGLLVDDEAARVLVASGAEIQISLDGADAEVHESIRGRGTWPKTWSAIERIVGAGGAGRLVISTTLTRASLAQVQSLIDRADALGINRLRFLQLNRSRAAATNWDTIAPDAEQLAAVTEFLIFDAPRRPNARTTVAAGFPGFVADILPGQDHWCPLGETAIVDSHGTVYTCPSLTTPEVTLGNVRVEGLDVLETGRRAAEARTRMKERRHRVAECRACAWRNFCQGGCAAYMELRTGHPDMNDEFCDLRRRLYRRLAVEKGR